MDFLVCHILAVTLIHHVIVAKSTFYANHWNVLFMAQNYEKNTTQTISLWNASFWLKRFKNQIMVSIPPEKVNRSYFHSDTISYYSFFQIQSFRNNIDQATRPWGADHNLPSDITSSDLEWHDLFIKISGPKWQVSGKAQDTTQILQDSVSLCCSNYVMII